MGLVELNYRPHAYQAGSYEHELGSEVLTSLPFHEHPAQYAAHLRTSCALSRTFCALEWTPQRTPPNIRARSTRGLRRYFNDCTLRATWERVQLIDALRGIALFGNDWAM